MGIAHVDLVSTRLRAQNRALWGVQAMTGKVMMA
jgi:hypothetical protein